MKKQKITALLVVFTLLFGIVFSASADGTTSGNIFLGLLAECSGQNDDSHIDYLTNKWNANTSANATVLNEEGTNYAWVQFNLSSAQKINKIFIQQKWITEDKAPLSRVADIAIDVRLATGGWKRVAAEYNIQAFYSGHTFTFQPVDAVAVRISVNGSRYNTTTFCVTEIEGYYNSSITTYSGVKAVDDELYAVPDGFPTMNLLTGLEATSSNTDNQLAESYPITNLTDGESGATAAAASITNETDSDNAWVQFKMPDAKNVNKVVIQQKADEDGKFPQVKDLAIDVMFGDGTWKRVAEEYNIEDTSAPTVITFEPVKAEVIRISTNGKRTASKLFNATEIEAYYDGSITEFSGVKTPDDSAYAIEMSFDKMNIFLGLTAKYSKMNDWGIANTPITNITDGNNGNGVAHSTVLNADGTSNAWVEFNLAEATNINKVYIQQKWDYANNKPLSKVVDIAVDVKLATGGWKRVASEYNIPSIYNGLTMTFETVKVIGVRITTSGVRYDAKYVSFTEVEGYCDSSLTEYSGIKEPDNELYAVPESTSSMNLLSSITGTSSNTSSWYATERPVTILTDGVTGPEASLASITNAGTTTHAWVQFQLPEAKAINKVVVQQRAYQNGAFARNKDLAVDVKLPDGSWKRVASEYNLASTYSPTTFTFEPIKAVAVRITTNGKRENSDSFNATEISAYYDAAITTYSGVKEPDESIYFIPLVPDLENLLLGLEATSSNINTWFKSERPVTNLTNGIAEIDSQPASITNCGTSQCAWLEFELPMAKDVNKVVIQQKGYENGSFPQVKDIAVDVLLSSGNWQRVAVTYNIADTANLAVLTFPTVNVTKIRIVTSSKRTDGWGFNATEIEAYCDSSLTEYSGIETPDDPDYKVVEICSIAEIEGLEELFGDAEIASSPSNAILSQSKELSFLNDGRSSSIDSKYSSITFNDGVAWFTVKMSKAKTINKVIIQNSMYDQPAGDLGVDVLLSDGSWKRVATLHDIQSYYENITFVFEPVETKSVRITANGKRYDCENFSLVEMVGYYDPTATFLTGNQTPDNEDYAVPQAKTRMEPVAKFDNLSTSGKGPYVPTP